jgi:ring-1,2-phenylacetyl-CoA epoxidase subunit PaaD
VRERLRTVKDPELPVVDIVELGLVREIEVDQGKIRVALTPTYSGCPALAMIQREVEEVLGDLGPAEVRVVQSPAWTTDWVTDEAKRKLAAYGIAPPPLRAQAHAHTVRCPQCDSPDGQLQSEFGSTACKAIWRCRSCLEPFELLKVI